MKFNFLFLFTISSCVVGQNITSVPVPTEFRALQQKAFENLNKKQERKKIHVQEEHGEEVPTEEVKKMVQHDAMQIKNRAKLPVVTDEDREDLSAATVESLADLHYPDGEHEIYLVKIIIGSQYVVHVKFATKRVYDKEGKSFTPAVDKSIVMTVLPDKVDTDKLSRDEFDYPKKFD